MRPILDLLIGWLITLAMAQVLCQRTDGWELKQFDNRDIGLERLPHMGDDLDAEE